MALFAKAVRKTESGKSGAGVRRVPKNAGNRRDFFLAKAVIFLFFCALMFTALFVAVRISLKVKDGPSGVTYTFNEVTGEEKKQLLKREYALRDVHRYGDYYVSLDDAAEILHLRYIGDSASVSLTSADGTDVITFGVGSQNCTVNGTLCKMTAPCVAIGKTVFVPSDVLAQYYAPVSTELDEEKMVFSFNYAADAVSPHFSVREVTAVAAVHIDGVDDGPDTGGKSIAQISFVADLEQYEDYMNPYDSSEFLVLVNAAHALAPTYVPAGLERIVDSNIPIDVKLRLSAKKSLEAMLTEARANGFIKLTVTDAYKDYGTINSEFNASVTREMNANAELSKEDAEARVLRYAQRAGTDELQTGLSCYVLNYGKVKEVFYESEEALWLADNCWKFGFILRYPADKEDVTGVSYRAYQFRYVGRYHAERMKDLGMCLEEYVKQNDIFA